MNTASLLLEIGVEELPSSFVDGALAALPTLVASKLGQARIVHGEVSVYGTPRRLAVIVADVAKMQVDLDEEVIGPPETAAFKDGKPTRAAEAFAEKLGVPLDSLQIAERTGGPKQKPGRYVIGRRVEKGVATEHLLGGKLADICAAIPFRKSMRWGDGDASFGRPIQWMVALFGNQTLKFQFAGIESSNITRGHRFLAPSAFQVRSAESYVAQMHEAHVVVDRAERERVMLEAVDQAAKELGGVRDPERSLVDENASLVEEPHIVRGSFDTSYLALPAPVIRAVARGHQKYFCIQKSEDELLPGYIAVVNTANDPKRIANGNNRVMTARLADARFFFEEDKKVAIASRVEKLSGIVFHNRLGTVREKVARMEQLSVAIARLLKCDEAAMKHVARAAELCKSDLVSLMVGEFPELQGDMGRAYAIAAGEPAAVANAIRDHYRPIGASDQIAPDDVSAIVALADRLDTLVGCFSVGLMPTGATDPFALRRACIAVLRTLIERSSHNKAFASLDLRVLALAAYDGFAAKKLDLARDPATSLVMEFASERLRGLLASATSQGVADAVMGAEHDIDGTAAEAATFPAYAMFKAQALQSLVDESAPWLGTAKMVAKRLGGISREAPPVMHSADAFTSPHDKTIVGVVRDIEKMTKHLVDIASMRHALQSAQVLADRIDTIFTTVLVNDPADAMTAQRLEVLSFGSKCMLKIADFSKLA